MVNSCMARMKNSAIEAKTEERLNTPVAAEWLFLY